MTHRGDMSQEGVQFLVSIEDALLRQIIGSPDRAHTLAPCLIIDRLDAAVRRDCCVVRPVRGHHHPRSLGLFQCHTPRRHNRRLLRAGPMLAQPGRWLSHPTGPLDDQTTTLISRGDVISFHGTFSYVVVVATTTHEAVRVRCSRADGWRGNGNGRARRRHLDAARARGYRPAGEAFPRGDHRGCDRDRRPGGPGRGVYAARGRGPGDRRGLAVPLCRNPRGPAGPDDRCHRCRICLPRAGR